MYGVNWHGASSPPALIYPERAGNEANIHDTKEETWEKYLKQTYYVSLVWHFCTSSLSGCMGCQLVEVHLQTGACRLAEEPTQQQTEAETFQANSSC